MIDYFSADNNSSFNENTRRPPCAVLSTRLGRPVQCSPHGRMGATSRAGIAYFSGVR